MLSSSKTPHLTILGFISDFEEVLTQEGQKFAKEKGADYYETKLGEQGALDQICINFYQKISKN